MKCISVLFKLSLCLLAIAVKAYGQDVNLDGIATIHISRAKADTFTLVSVGTLHSFPFYDYSEKLDTLSFEKNEIWLSCPVRTLQEGTISIGDKSLRIILVPGDTIKLNVGGSPAIPEFQFSGKNSEVQNYHLAKSMRFPVSVGQLILTAGMNEENLDFFKVKADSLHLLEVEFFDQYKKKQKLPSWFLRFESDAIRYADAMLRLYVLNYQKVVQHKTKEPGKEYFNFLKTVPIRNIAARNDYSYVYFLQEFMQYRIQLDYVQDSDHHTEFKLATEVLGKDLADFYILSSIGSRLSNNPVQVKAELESRTFPDSLKYLVTYLQQRATAKTKILSTGDKSPNFFLVDKLDSLVSLDQFKGNVVYLSFWFEGCKGCIHEFPFENEMVRNFEGKPVKIISICTHTKKERWVSTIDKYDLKTINLFANASWASKLEEKYAINVYPQYVLIDEMGNVIENFATRPSEGASKKIESAVAAMKEK